MLAALSTSDHLSVAHWAEFFEHPGFGSEIHCAEMLRRGWCCWMCAFTGCELKMFASVFGVWCALCIAVKLQVALAARS